MSLETLVNAYRSVGRPNILNGTFEFNCALTSELSLLVKDLFRESKELIDHLSIDGEEPTCIEDIRQNREIDCVIRTPTNTAERFFKSIRELIEFRTLLKGDLPRSFYIVDEDYFSSDSVKNVKIENIKILCRLIKHLSNLAVYHDYKASSEKYKLVFFNPDNGSGIKSIEITPDITTELVELNTINLDVIESLCSESFENAHAETRKDVFRVTVAEFISKKSSNDSIFAYIVKNWNDLLLEYKNNLSVYMSGFAFHKAKREVASAEFEISGQYSKVISDITGKLLSLPLSVIGIIRMLNTQSSKERGLILAGLFLIGLILYLIIRNQEGQLGRIRHAKNIVLGAFEGKEEIYPDDLKSSIQEMKSSLVIEETKLVGRLGVFKMCAWLPFIFGFIAVVILDYQKYAMVFVRCWQFLLNLLGIYVSP
ncbi:hypothetical protein [Desulfogranum marinum]|uniref:hypothetical protein n=1 Tax=Desulfogranum marinum TaxID=453220 RepID=UPI0029C7E8AD|nr:hypothetical protein [Desulfogranum marinum]